MNARLPVVALSATLASIATAALIDVPQSRQEFVKVVAGGRGAPVETLQIDQSLDKVYAVLEERANACLDVTVQRTAYVGYVERSSSDYNPTLRRVAKDRAEFTLQVQHNPRGVGHHPPEGGLYMMAADLRSIDGGHTEVVLYKPNIGVKKVEASLKQWVAGHTAPCPKLK